MKWQPLFAGAVLALALIGVAAAGQLEDASAARQRGDYATAVSLYRPLADKGNAIAQTILGTMYAMGQSVPEDGAQALFWFRKAADQGNATSQFSLGLMYANGRGVPQDYERAHMWFNLAGSRKDDTELREHALKNRDQVAAKLTPSQIADAQRLAREWKPAK
jgi:TPR repeat protein